MAFNPYSMLGSGPTINPQDQEGKDGFNLKSLFNMLGPLLEGDNGGGLASLAGGPAGLAASVGSNELKKGVQSYQDYRNIRNFDTDVDKNNLQQSLLSRGSLEERGREENKFKLGPLGPLRMLLGGKAKREATRKSEELEQNILEQQGTMNQQALRTDLENQQGDVFNARLRQLDPYRISNNIR